MEAEAIDAFRLVGAEHDLSALQTSHLSVNCKCHRRLAKRSSGMTMAQNRIRSYILTGSVTVIVLLGSFYGAGLKSQHQVDAVCWLFT